MASKSTSDPFLRQRRRKKEKNKEGKHINENIENYD